MKHHLVGFMCCYNEADIIRETLRFYERLEVPIVVIDNGSTDGSAEIVQSQAGHTVIRYMRHETGAFDLRLMLDLALEVVSEYEPRWIMHIDADHFYEPGVGFASIWDHIADAERLMCNVIDFDEFVFFPTTADVIDGRTHYDRIKHYAFRAPGTPQVAYQSGAQIRQPRLYRYMTEMNISTDGGHTIFYSTDQVRMHPNRGVLRHYMFRSVEHAKRKLRERYARYSAAGRARGWHTQYDGWCRTDEFFLRAADSLVFRVEGEPWRRDVVLLADGTIEYELPAT